MEQINLDEMDESKFPSFKIRKKEVIVFGSKESNNSESVYVSTPGAKNQRPCLKLWCSNRLRSECYISHIKAVTKTALYHLKKISRIKGLLPLQDLNSLIHTFITSRVDFSNGLLTEHLKKTIKQL